MNISRGSFIQREVGLCSTPPKKKKIRSKLEPRSILSYSTKAQEAIVEIEISREWVNFICHAYIDINAISFFRDLSIFQYQRMNVLTKTRTWNSTSCVQI